MPEVGPYEPVLDRFAEHLRSVRNRAPSTVANCRHYIACFLGWWLGQHGPRALDDVRSRAHTATLTDLRGRQRHAIISTLRYTGARAGEVSNLRLDRVDLAGRRIEVLGKGSRHRLLAVPRPLATTLEEFLADVRPQLPSTPYVFVNTHPFVPDPDRRCSVSALQRECRLAAQGAGLPGRHYPHRWRHSFATELIRAGMGVAQVQRQLGHASIVSTMLYTHLDVEDVRRSLDEVFDQP